MVPLLGPCSHCYLDYPEATDGPCAISAKYPGICMNIAQNRVCSPTSGSYTGQCNSKVLGSFEITAVANLINNLFDIRAPLPYSF